MTKLRAMQGFILLAGLTGFAFQHGQKSVEATEPNPCPKQDCRHLYGWWISCNPGGQKCMAAELDHTDQNGGPSKDTHTEHAIPFIYAVLGNGNRVSDNGKYDRYICPSNNPTCGKENGQWQSPQEVAPAGTGVYASWENRLKCVVTGD